MKSSRAVPVVPPADVVASPRHILLLTSIVIAALVLPSVIWVCRDNRVWPWDQAWYGQVSMALVRTAHIGFGSWWHVMLSGMPSKPPLLTWVGQFAVPLSSTVGSPERALLLVNVAANAGTLFVVFAIAHRLSRSIIAAMVAVIFCGGSSLFIGMAHQYFVEPLQTLALALIMHISLAAPRLRLLPLLFKLLAAISFAMIAKTTSTGFILPFLLYVLIARLTMSPPATVFRRSDAGLAILSVAIFALSFAWYAKNWASMVQHFTNSTSSEIALHYGTIGSLGAKLLFWMQALGGAVSPWPLGVAAAVALVLLSFVVASVRVARFPWRDIISRSVESGALFAWCCIGTLTSGMVAYALQINEETRFLLPMVVLLAVLLSFALGVFKHQVVSLTIGVFSFANATCAHLYAHQLISSLPGHSAWLQPFESDEHSVQRLTTAVNLTCDRSKPSRYRIIGVEIPEFNANSAAFYAEKLQRRGVYDCYYTSLGYAETDVQRAIKRIYDLDTEFFITFPMEKIPVSVPGDFLNHVDLPVARYVATNKDFRVISTDENQLQIFYRGR